MQISREYIKRLMEGGRGGSSVAGTNVGGASIAQMESLLTNYATQPWVENGYLSKAFFNELFTIHAKKTVVENAGTEEETTTTTDITVSPNDWPVNGGGITYQITGIELKYGAWTNSYMSALGQNGVVSGGGGGGGGSVTSVGLSMPTGFNVTHTPVTGADTLTVAFAEGYSLPAIAKQTQWDTAYTNSHTHSNKSILDSITQGKLTNWDGAYTFAAGSGFGTEGTDYVPITLGSTTKNVLTAHQSLAGYATQQWVGQQEFLTGITAEMINSALGFTLSGTSGSNYNLATIASNAAHGETAYGWGNHATQGYATQTWVGQNYLSIAFFSRLFQAYNGTTEVTPNDTTTTIDNIKAMFGFWTNQYLSALGQNSAISSASSLSELSDVLLSSPSAGQVLTYRNGKWRNEAPTTSGGTVTSVAMSVPTGFSISGSPITSTGTLAITFASGYSLPTTTKQTQWDAAYTNSHTHSNKSVIDGITSTQVGNWDAAYTNSHTHSNKSVIDGITSTQVGNWDTAYGWGNHATQGYATQTWVGQNYLSIAFFSRLFQAYNNTTEVTPNDTTTTIDNIKAMFGFWTNQYLSALGQNSAISSASSLSELSDVLLSSPSAGQVLTYRNGKWRNEAPAASGGTVTSVAMSVPTGFSISGSPITSTGTLALTFASGYSLPTTTKQSNWDAAYTNSHTHSNKSVIDGITSTKVGNWDTAYGWGNHANQGYLKSVAFGDLTSHPTTLSGYGITDALGINATAAAATKLATARKLWGNNFDGTADLTTSLKIANANGIIFYKSDGTTEVQVLGYDSRGNSLVGDSGSATYLRGKNIYLNYGTGNTTGITLDSSGNVGIGGISSNANFYVKNTSFFGNKVGVCGTTTTDHNLYVYGGTYLNGTLGVGGYSSSYRLYVSGTSYFTNNVTIASGKTLTIGSITIKEENDGLHIIGGGLYTDTYLSALGVNSNTSGGSGATSLSELSDVNPNLNPTNWQVLAYGSSLGKWTSATLGTLTIKNGSTNLGSWIPTSTGYIDISSAITGNYIAKPSSAVGSTTLGVYVNSSGVVSEMAYYLQTNVNSGTSKRLAYYDMVNSGNTGYEVIKAVGNINYISETNSKNADVRGLRIWGNTYGNTASTLISGTKGELVYGDGGPQIQFSTGASKAQDGAIIFTDNNQGIGSGTSFHFVSTGDTGTDYANTWVVSHNFWARTSVKIGSTVLKEGSTTGNLTIDNNTILHAGNYTNYISGGSGTVTGVTAGTGLRIGTNTSGGTISTSGTISLTQDYINKINDGESAYTTLSNNDFAPLSSLEDYLPLSGGTMTGNVNHKSSSLQRGVTPSTRTVLYRAWTDKKDKPLGWFEFVSGTDGVNHVGLFVLTNTDSSSSNEWGGFLVKKTQGVSGNHNMTYDANTGQLQVNGSVYLGSGYSINASTGDGLLTYKPSGWTGVSNSQWGAGAINCQGVIRSDNTNLVHYRSGVGNYYLLDTYNFPSYAPSIAVASGTQIGHTSTPFNLRSIVLTAGTYWCTSGTNAKKIYDGYTSGTTNDTKTCLPYVDGNFRLWHIINTGGLSSVTDQWSAQIMLCPNDARMFIRRSSENTYSEWNMFAMLKRVGTTNGNDIMVYNTYEIQLPSFPYRSSAGSTTFSYQSCEYLRIPSSTKLCFNSTSTYIYGQIPNTNVYVLQLYGKDGINANRAITTSSDMRLKDVDRLINDVEVRDIASAPIFDFTWKDNPNGAKQLGTSAQFWQNVLPNAVLKLGDKLSLDYGATALASAVITARKVVDHETRIAALEKENEQLRKELETLKAA